MTANYFDDLIKNKYPEVNIISTSTGSDDQGGFASIFSAGGTHTITYNLSLVPIEDRKKSVFEIVEEMRADFAKRPEIINFTLSTSDNMGSFGGSTVDVEVYGYNISETNLVAEELANKIKEYSGCKGCKDKPCKIKT